MSLTSQIVNVIVKLDPMTYYEPLLVVHSRDKEGYGMGQTMKLIHLKSVKIFLDDDGAALVR